MDALEVHITMPVHQNIHPEFTNCVNHHRHVRKPPRGESKKKTEREGLTPNISCCSCRSAGRRITACRILTITNWNRNKQIGCAITPPEGDEARTRQHNRYATKKHGSIPVPNVRWWRGGPGSLLLVVLGGMVWPQ
jgi:hypothetical protein